MANPRIFDETHRSDGSPAKGVEDTYRFLNRISGAFWDEVRELIEDWFARYPADKGPALAGRIRSDSYGFWGAYLELFLHEILIRIGASVEVDPELPGGRTPDFRISHSDKSFLLEATTLMEPQKDERANRRNAPMLDALRKVKSAEFMISVDRVAQGPDQPAGTRLAAQLEEWLSQLDYSEIRAAALRSWSDVPTATLFDRGWEVVVRPIPKAEDRHILSEISILEPSQGRFVDDHAAMCTDLQEKARKYRSVGEPLVLAVSNRRWTADREEVRVALFGAAWEHPRMMKALQIDPNWRKVPEGLWLTRTGARYAEVAAVLEVDKVSPWHVTDGRVTAWRNPLARDAIGPLPFQQVSVDLEHGTFDSRDPSRSIAEILAIPSDWPHGEPFPRNS